jgi:mono/diheme cytochrome c family protein
MDSMNSKLLFFCLASALLVGTCSSVLYSSSSKADASKTKRGRYLVESVAICFECHSERDYSKDGWPIPKGKLGSGRILWGQLVAPNISSDVETGIGSWTDAEIARAIRNGISRDGRTLNPEMPSRYFSELSADDLDSIVVFLRSIPPIRNKLPKCSPYLPGANPSAVAMDSLTLTHSTPEILRGKSLVRLASCKTCHTPANASGYIRGLEFAGGSVFTHGNESAASSNLTPDASGIAYYSQESFVQAIRTGRVGGRSLNSAMPWYFYRNMDATDLKAVFAYLRAIPPVVHRVDNSEKPTLCRLCGNRHGNGERN